MRIVALAFAIALAPPASAGVLRSVNLEFGVQGYGTGMSNLWDLDPPSGSFAGTISGGIASGRIAYFGHFSPFPGPTLTNPTAPISRIRFHPYNAGAGGTLPGGARAGMEAAITWFAGGKQLARNYAPNFMTHQMITSPGATLTLAVGRFTLGRASITGLTLNEAPNPSAATLTETGGYSVTAAGDVHVQLVSLGRIRVRGIETSNRALIARLTLVFVPEPAGPLLLGVAVLALAGAQRRLRRARAR